MSDWRDVMKARSHANEKLRVALEHVQDERPQPLQAWAGQIALVYCTQAICAELRALATAITWQRPR